MFEKQCLQIQVGPKKSYHLRNGDLSRCKQTLKNSRNVVLQDLVFFLRLWIR